MSIRGLGNNNNRFDISSAKKTGAAAKGAQAAGAAGAAAGVAKAGAASKNEDVLKLSAVAGQAGEAPQISLGSAGPLPKTMHTDALAKASKVMTPEARQDKSCEYIADRLYAEFEKMFKAG